MAAFNAECRGALPRDSTPAGSRRTRLSTLPRSDFAAIGARSAERWKRRASLAMQRGTDRPRFNERMAIRDRARITVRH